MAENQVIDFYVERAIHHGEMATYYAKRIEPAIFETNFDLEWSLKHVVIEAREAWHYALLLSQEQIAAEIERQIEAARQDGRLLF